jgi:hypothetical protein
VTARNVAKAHRSVRLARAAMNEKPLFEHHAFRSTRCSQAAAGRDLASAALPDIRPRFRSATRGNNRNSNSDRNPPAGARAAPSEYSIMPIIKVLAHMISRKRLSISIRPCNQRPSLPQPAGRVSSDGRQLTLNIGFIALGIHCGESASVGPVPEAHQSAPVRSAGFAPAILVPTPARAAARHPGIVSLVGSSRLISLCNRAVSCSRSSTNSTPIPFADVLRTAARARISPSGTERSTVMSVPSGQGVCVAMNKPPTFKSCTRDTSCRAPSCHATHTPFGVEMRA